MSESQSAGLYGSEPPTHKTECRHSNNPNGHNRDCECGWWQPIRPSQTVPYALPDCPASRCDLDDHYECWADYSRQEDKRKYEKGML